MSVVGNTNSKSFTVYFRVVNGEVSFRYPSMDVSSVRAEKKADVLLAKLSELGYSPSTIKADKWFLGVICRTFQVSESVEERMTRYVKIFKKYSSETKYRPELTIVRRWMLFDFYDTLPSAVSTRAVGSNVVNDRLSASFCETIDKYTIAARHKGLRESTIRAGKGSLGRFFSFLMDHELIYDVDQITESSIRNYKVASGVSNAIVHRIGTMMNLIGAPCARLFPGSRGTKKTVFEGLSRSEMTKFKEYVHTSTDLSLRDKAICLMLTYFGPRCSDIRHLKKEHIHWNEGYIAFYQGKTGQYVSYPLLPEIGFAIRRYLDQERPDCDLPFVFISEHRRGGRYACVSPDKIVNGVYTKCGIRNGKVRKGTHIIRHALATALLEEGEDFSVISDVLGHSSVNSSLTYLSADIEALRRCSLDVAVFPVNAKVYAI